MRFDDDPATDPEAWSDEELEVIDDEPAPAAASTAASAPSAAAAATAETAPKICVGTRVQVDTEEGRKYSYGPM